MAGATERMVKRNRTWSPVETCCGVFASSTPKLMVGKPIAEVTGGEKSRKRGRKRKNPLKRVRSRLDGILFMLFCSSFQGSGKVVIFFGIKCCQKCDCIIAQAKEILSASDFNETEGLFSHEVTGLKNFNLRLSVGVGEREPFSGQAIDDEEKTKNDQ